MTSTKPYLVRAFNEWILDNQLTPYLLINAEHPKVFVPKEYVQDGKIVFNITPGIVSTLSITNEVIEFDARFSGKQRHVYAPMSAVLAIYAKENGRGMVFEPEEETEDETGSTTSPPPTSDDSPPKKGKPSLKVIK